MSLHLEKRTNETLKKKRTLAVGIGLVFSFILVIMAWQQSGSNSQTIEDIAHATTKDLNSRPTLDFSKYEGCTIGTIPSASLSKIAELKNMKPFWVPSYPGSDAGLFRSIMVSLTGLKTASKSYYAKANGLVKCHDIKTATISCEQIHPVVAIGPPPQNQADKYQTKIIFPIRNPATALPAHHQNKAEMYHEQQGQVDVQAWREFRDTWLEETLFQNWRQVLDTWKHMSPLYEVGLYFPLEHLLDPVKGPVLVQQLADLLREAGVPTIDDSDVPCAWYQTVSPVLMKNGHAHYDFATDYLPGYTASQKRFMLNQLKNMKQEYGTDADLTQLLGEYMGEIRQETITDNEKFKIKKKDNGRLLRY